MISILIFIYTIHFAYLKVYTKFEKELRSVTEFSLERKRIEQIKGLISIIWLIFVTQHNSSLSSFVPNFRFLSQAVAEKSLTEKSSLERKKNEQIKGLISNMWLLLFLLHKTTHHYQALYRIS